ncbi:pectate lyase [Novipirellula artificiosorum]|uniref:Pectic acid lyase n=1 Tax=Novipirellula artificiosorum TaxID=2528016 RepID=A0A5C6D6P5_9BACT|nr:pectate lyase [Novipirellula artificiosorum]TWU31371.1 Pectic acid lyase [Novipirellula artificiosorum]
MHTRFALIALSFVCLVDSTPNATALDASSDQSNPLSLVQAERSLQKAVTFLRGKLSTDGGYVWLYSDDLSRREGEGKVGSTTVWVQPPGTPAVGEALLLAYERTRQSYLADAVKETAMCLVRGQLHSGGWDYRIEFAPKERSRYAYRVDGPADKKRNVTTLDDNTSQAAIRFLMRADATFQFKNESIHEAAAYALSHLVDAQYPNGAWPQRFDRPPEAAEYPVLKASYPESWSREFPKSDYKEYYTYNDNTIVDTIELMFEAAEIYDEHRYFESAVRAGRFILLSQMPDPQPAWAQQYNAKMQPAWARKFEPPAITGGESQKVLQALLEIYRHTGDKTFLDPIPQAIAYLKRSQLADGRLARFYELRTNNPLFFTMDYQLTYGSDDMPTHYAFIVGSNLERIEKQYQRTIGEPWKPIQRKLSQPFRMTPTLTSDAEQVVQRLDLRGAWSETARLKYHGEDDPTRNVLSMRTLAKNIEVLSRYIAAAKAE